MISDIDPATPTGQNLVLDGDNEIRAFKMDVLETFPYMNTTPMQDADTSGENGTVPVTAKTMSSWEARIAALEDLATSPDGTSIPVGGIILWRGQASSWPVGFAECNGSIYTYTDNNGDEQTVTSPDMRGRMAMHPRGGSLTSGQTAGTLFDSGVMYITTDATGAHTHSVATPSHTLTSGEIPFHSHTNPLVGFNAAAGSNQVATFGTQNSLAATGPYGGGNGHTHPTTNSGSNGNHFHRMDAAPPVYGLYYLMYVAS